MLNLLHQMAVPTPSGAQRSGLEILLQTWTENAETFQGFWASRVSTLALMDLFVASFADNGEWLRNVVVKGELVVRAETRNGECGLNLPAVSAGGGGASCECTMDADYGLSMW